ncbi:MAG: hypothetical protein LBT09_02675 [Planctomycetaceae bacterium]|jgi:hypothetical protein|nr:hypothetical protein [Planctomycetaceae bacterium]
MKRINLFFFSAIALIAFSGCGEKLPPDLPKLHSTILTVVQEGKPLDDASVQLIPKGFDSKWSANGVTDKSGKVEFYTHGKYKGVAEGTYRVVVQKTFTEEPKYAGQVHPPEGVSYEKWQQMLASDKPQSYNLVDLKFGSRDSSPLEIVVDPDSKKERSIDVGKSIREEIKPPPM